MADVSGRLMTIRSKKMLSAAKDQSCMNCGANDGTVVAAHYSGLRSHAFGKGTGHKPHDILVADLCRSCHESFDQNRAMGHVSESTLRRIDQSEQFLYLILQTLLRRIDQGVVKVEGNRSG
jgi:hypothetical protein